jgi:hypothetical protein
LLRNCFGGSRRFTDVLVQVWPFQWSTPVRPYAHTSFADRALPPPRFFPTSDQEWPS